jgi:hypothetical protein
MAKQIPFVEALEKAGLRVAGEVRFRQPHTTVTITTTHMHTHTHTHAHVKP